MNTNRHYSDEEIQEIIDKIRRKNMYDEAVIQLVRRDLESGLTRDETMEYCKKDWTIAQRRIYSDLLHRHATDDVKKTICGEGLDTAQMQVLYNYYLYGVPIGKLKEALREDQQPNHLKELLNRVLENMGIDIPKDDVATNEAVDASKSRDSELETVSEEKIEFTKNTDELKEDMSNETPEDELNHRDKAAFSNDAKQEDTKVQESNSNPEMSAFIKTMNGQLEKQDQFYGQMVELMGKMMKQNEDDAVTKGLLDKYNAQEEQLASQQNELNQANRALARLRAEKETAERELQKLKEKQIADEKAASKETAKEEHSSETKESEIKQSQEEGGQSNMGVAQSAFASQPIPPAPKGTIPVYYQVPMTQNGQVIQQVEVERSTRKAVGGVGIFSKLFLKKKSRIDLVSRLAAGDMLPEQLAQIRVAIEKGLYEEQLVELINHNVPVAKMKEIIEIAVLENNMA